jgi:hypothetical protein
MSKVNKDNNDYLFRLLTEDGMSESINSTTLNTIASKQIFIFFNVFNSDIHFIKPTYLATKSNVQDYATYDDNPKKLLFDVIQKLNASEDKEFINTRDILNNTTFNNFMLNRKDDKNETALDTLKALMNEKYNENSTKYYINMFPPKYIIKTNQAKKEIEEGLIQLKKAEAAVTPDENSIKRLSIQIGKLATQYPETAATAVTEAGKEELRAKGALPVAPAAADSDLNNVYEYAQKHNTKAKALKREADDFIKKPDVAKCIAVFKEDDRDEKERAATKAAVLESTAELASAAKVSTAAQSANTHTNSAYILANDRLQKTIKLKTKYNDTIILTKPTGDAAAAAAVAENKTHAQKFLIEAQQAAELAKNALDLYSRYKLNKIYFGYSNLKSKIDEVNRQANNLVKEAKNAKTLAEIKALDDDWVIMVATPTTLVADKENMLKNFANLINAETINITKGTGAYKADGYGDTSYTADTTPRVELMLGEEPYWYGTSSGWKYKIPKLGDTALRKAWRKKRIDRWTLNDLKLKYIFNDSNLLGIGKGLAATAPPTPNCDIYKELDDVRHEYYNNIQKIEKEKTESGDDTEKAEVRAKPLAMSGGGKQYNKKTFKNKQFKRKQTHRKQTHRKQKHRKQKHRKQTHKK